MRGNPLRGSVPEAFGSMVSLENLDLSGCQLEGELPNSLKILSHLKSLDLSDNNFTSQLFEFFQNEMNSLEVLNLAWNKLSGSLPDLTLFRSLRELHLNNNQLQGIVSEAYLSNLSKLKIFDLSFNSLALEFSFNWDPPFQLEIIRLAYCKLGPNFPKWLQSQKNLSALDISGAGISDSIPNRFWDLQTRLEILNISYNQIQGVIPDLSQKFANYAFIDLSSNHFHGLIPLLPPNVSVLRLSNNMFTGSVRFLCARIFSLDVSDNLLSGELPDCWMPLGYLTYLNLANNNFSGKIPPSIGFLDSLEILQLRNNSFTGELPSSLKNCSELTLLDLSENKVSGEVPTWIGTHLRRLIVISLRKNELFGSIPPHICYLSHAQVLDLSQNYISGDIPICFNNLTSLLQIDSLNPFADGGIGFQTQDNSFLPTYVGNALVQWKGKESYYRKTLGLLKLIDLSRNKLAGKIPEEFAGLEGLISLNLSVNNLTGNIIQKIGQMRMLESLDLSRNQLSGDIPMGLASLTLLSVLDLSDNNFMGKIPLSTQLQGLNASVYAGNEKLCGLPLPSKCPGDELNRPRPPVGHGKDGNNEEDKDKFVTIGFYISVLLGFAFGFWGFFGPILLRSTWRRTYFKYLDKTKDWIYVTTAVNMARLQRKLGG